MQIVSVELSDQEHTALCALAEKAGTTLSEMVRDALAQYLARHEETARLQLLAQAMGMWQDRTDLPSLEDLRREWDRGDS